jgi:hypothetical protein
MQQAAIFAQILGVSIGAEDCNDGEFVDELECQ